MLMRHSVLIKKLGHLCRDHIPIVWNRNEGDFFARFWCRFRHGGLFLWLFRMWRVIHINQHYTLK